MRDRYEPKPAAKPKTTTTATAQTPTYSSTPPDVQNLARIAGAPTIKPAVAPAKAPAPKPASTPAKQNLVVGSTAPLNTATQAEIDAQRAKVDALIAQANAQGNQGFSPSNQSAGITTIGDSYGGGGATTYTPPAPKNYDYSPDVNASYDKLGESTKARLRANLNAALSKFSGMKDIANQNKISNLNANDATMLQNLQRLYNSNEAQGQYGDSGANVTGQIQLGAVQGQNANAIRQDTTNYINSLDAEANTLQNTAADQETAAIGEIEAQRLKDLQRAREYADSMDMQNQQFQYGISKDQQDRLDKLQQLQSQNGQWQQSFEAEQKWKEYEASQAQRETEWAQSEDNPAVKAQILSNQIKELELQNLPEKQRLEIQQLKEEIKQIGAVKPQSNYEQEILRVKLETAKEELYQIQNPNFTSTGKSTSQPEKQSQSEVSNYWTSSAMTQLDKLPNDQRKQWLENNKAEIVKNAGPNTYDYLKSAYQIY